MIRLSDKVIADPPVVLAPMAGITNVAFRRLCREHGAGLYVSEMITSRALVERNPKTMRLIRFAPAHTSGDLIVYLPDQKIAFTGNITVARLPYPLIHLEDEGSSNGRSKA